MSPLRLRRALKALLLVSTLLLTPALAHARPAADRPVGTRVDTAVSAASGLLGSWWHWLNHLLAGVTTTGATPSGDSGGSIDPNGGKPAGQAGVVTGDSGGSIDPNG
ncbi:MAG TPA: hypothetical protein VMM92_08775 [Thermoanaerobaculia bacterium]|nr:hypothetical protein [Thermoanaerobaculia bacterium]